MSYPEDENEHQPKPQEAEEAFLNNYEQDIIARVPFGGAEVMTESFHRNPNIFPKKER